MFFFHVDYLASSSRGFLSNFINATQKKFKPAFPVPTVPDSLKAVIVFSTIFLEIVGDVE